ncbi:MAG TPA: S49 family peptidase, partial [Anaerolineae bacterium]|nr:S49 family peptidase [Anaerolineae bacterium]
LPEEEVRALADGRVFTGRQALGLGLVDAEGGQSEAIQMAAQMGGIKGEPRIVRFERPPGLLGALLGVMSRARRPTELILLEDLLGRGRVPSLQYLYTGP